MEMLSELSDNGLELAAIKLKYQDSTAAEAASRSHLEEWRWDAHACRRLAVSPKFSQDRVREVIAAMTSTADARDNNAEVERWRKFVETDATRLEQAAWRLVSRIQRFHREGGPADIQPEHVKDMKMWRGKFNEHFETVLKLLRSWKATCFDVRNGDLAYIVENPRYVEIRKEKNLKCNNDRKTKKPNSNIARRGSAPVAHSGNLVNTAPAFYESEAEGPWPSLTMQDHLEAWYPDPGLAFVPYAENEPLDFIIDQFRHPSYPNNQAANDDCSFW